MARSKPRELAETGALQPALDGTVPLRPEPSTRSTQNRKSVKCWDRSFSAIKQAPRSGFGASGKPADDFRPAGRVVDTSLSTHLAWPGSEFHQPRAAQNVGGVLTQMIRAVLSLMFR